MNGVTKLLGLFLALGASSACGAFERTTVDPHAAASVVVDKLDPPRVCELLGEVSGDALIGDLPAAKRDLIRNAVEGGGNYVAIDETERHPGGYGVRGRLFACPTVMPPPSPATCVEPAKPAAMPVAVAVAPAAPVAPIAPVAALEPKRIEPVHPVMKPVEVRVPEMVIEAPRVSALVETK